MREVDQVEVEEYECNHEGMIERLEELINRKYIVSTSPTKLTRLHLVCNR